MSELARLCLLATLNGRPLSGATSRILAADCVRCRVIGRSLEVASGVREGDTGEPYVISGFEGTEMAARYATAALRISSKHVLLVSGSWGDSS
jgi:hypothetical protein